MTTEQARSFLTALIRDANDALAHLADDRLDRAREDVRCLDSDAANIVDGLRDLAAEQPRCCNDVCSDCQPLDAAEYA